MEQLSRKEIKEIFDESVAQIVTSFEAGHTAHEKEIDRLTKQSMEHYEAIKALDSKITGQITTCQSGNYKSQENSGIRAGKMENDIARIDQKIKDLEEDMAEMKSNKQFNISQWLVAGGMVLVVIFGILDRVGI